MKYIDVDYAVKNSFSNTISKDSDVVDVYFVRKSHHCKKTNSYWDNKQDETIYLKIKDEDSKVERTVCLAKNEVNETEMYFNDESEKIAFYNDFRDNDFYNHLSVYCPLNEKQAIQFLAIMAKNIDDYDYNFQYCDQDRVIKNIINDSLKKNSTVTAAYDLYLECSKKSNQSSEVDYMVREATNDNVVAFPTKVNSNR